MNSVFEKLDSIDVSSKSEKKGMFTYLSWAWAVRELLRVAPDATWETHDWEVNGVRQPYMETEAGCFVKVSVTVNDITREQVHPVLDNRNQTIKKPNAFEVNTSIQRCLAKAIALHGLGLYIFAGEDLPDTYISPDEIKYLEAIAKKVGEPHLSKVKNALEHGKVNKSNLEKTVQALEQLISKEKDKETDNV